MARYPEVGDRAPDFSLPISSRENVALSEVLQRGKAVVAFYVLDFSSP